MSVPVADSPSLQAKESIAIALPLSVVVLGLEARLWAAWATQEMGLGLGLACHLAILIGILCAILVARCFVYDERLVQCLLIFTAILGPFGALLGAVMSLFYLGYRRLTSPFSELLEQLYPESTSRTEAARLSQRIERGLENADLDTTPLSFMDIMNFGSLFQRQRAISLTVRYFTPSLAPILYKGLHDLNNSIRVLAATSLLALEKNYHNAYLLLEERVLARPTDHRALLELAKHAEAYADSRILSSERQIKMLNAARSAYFKYAEAVGWDDNLELAVARLDFRVGESSLARARLEKMCSAPQHRIEAEKLLYEVLFEMKDYPAVRVLAERTPADCHGSEVDSQVVLGLRRFWSGKLAVPDARTSDVR